MMSAEPWALSIEKGKNICTDVSLNYHVALARGFEAGKVFALAKKKGCKGIIFRQNR
jgi:hypothetical protein